MKNDVTVNVSRDTENAGEWIVTATIVSPAGLTTTRKWDMFFTRSDADAYAIEKETSLMYLDVAADVARKNSAK